ncbi:MAG: hypothetical protein ABI183_19145 [Polyangiaceae bacterium]
MLGAAVVAIVSLAARDVRAMPPEIIQVAVDHDDDDLDGHIDTDDSPLAAVARAQLESLESLAGGSFHPISGGDLVRVVGPDGKVVGWDSVLPRGSILQGISPGRATLQFIRKKVNVEQRVFEVVALGFRDGALHDLDLSKERASLERLPPDRAPTSADARYKDFDALRATLMMKDDSGAPLGNEFIGVESISATGATIDRLDVSVERTTPCPDTFLCYATPPLRFVVDDVDRTHPLALGRSLRAEVGGAIKLRYGFSSQMIRVEGPRASPVGPIPRLRATVRPFVLRVAPKAGPAVGGTDAGAVLAVRSELALASAAWGQCGITFGKTDAIDVKVVDPPPSYLISFGDDLGLPASGGTVHVRIDGKNISSLTTAGSSPLGAARAFAEASRKAGFSAAVSPNARVLPGAGGSVDVLVHNGGSLAHIEPLTAKTAVTDDSTMVVRIGSVDLSDGLFHFGDMDSMSGTLEERTLVKAFDDGDPSTIEVMFVPAFGGGDRIGESFIQNDMSSVRDIVLLDRAGVRARRMSSTLAHEIGHVLMNAPGHPDDYGLDTPTLLMDSDGADAAAFGPRRLTLDECARAVREAGPNSRVPLLTAWPLTPLKLR